MKKIVSFLCLGALLVSLSACTPKAADYTQKDLYAMDTVMSFKIYNDSSGALCDGCSQIIQTLEQELSVTDESSPVALLNKTGHGTISDNAAALLQQTLSLSARTDGALDPTIYPIVKLWGFTTQQYHVPSQAEITQTLQRVSPQNVDLQTDTVTLSNQAQLDFGAVAKGYAGQLCADYLSEHNACGTVSLGGNVQTVGTKPDGSDWQIGVTDPDDTTAYVAILKLSGTNSVVTSGSYQRYFEQDGHYYHHIMDPSTGAPAQSGLRSVTIVTQDGLLADGLSTALFVMGLDKASDFWRQSDDFEAVFITDDNEIYVTDGLKDRISGSKFTEISR